MAENSYRLITRYYRTSQSAEIVYNITDLQKVTMHNNQIEAFQNAWEMVLAGMSKDLDEDVLEVLYFERIERHIPASLRRPPNIIG